jgi:hypothetical protein
MNNGTAETILSRETGTTVLAAASSDQEALEGYKDHGLFAYVVAVGLRGEGDGNKNGVVTTANLTQYVMNQLPPLALNLYKHEQQSTAEMSGGSFPITKVK